MKTADEQVISHQFYRNEKLKKNEQNRKQNQQQKSAMSRTKCIKATTQGVEFAVSILQSPFQQQRIVTSIVLKLLCDRTQPVTRSQIRGTRQVALSSPDAQTSVNESPGHWGSLSEINNI